MPPEPLAYILGPCVIESLDQCLRVASRLAALAERRGLEVFFKASFDKANRTRHDAPRGPGLDEGLRVLDEVRRQTGLPILTDIHTPAQAAPVAEVADVLQIPAFLCRQTDLLTAAARTGKPVNVKKGQFLAPADMRHVRDKLTAAGAVDVWLCERGAAFGHRDLVVDMRGLITMADLAHEVGGRLVFDATHSAQRPGALEGQSGGDRRVVLPLARAAVAVGVDMLFAEVHPDPPRALSDAATQWPLDQLDVLIDQTLAIAAARVAALG